jgi:hypothetical protein
MGNRFFTAQIAVFSMLAFSAASMSRAASTGTTATQAPATAPANPTPQSTEDPTYLPWSDATAYESCDQTCLLQKGNENLSLHALYILKRMGSVQSLFLAGKDSSTKDFSAFQTEIQGLCPDFKTSTDQDQATVCFNRYMRGQLGTLRQMKNAIATNQSTLIGYRSDVAGVGTNGTINRKTVSPNAVEAGGTGVSKLPQTSYATDLKTSADVKKAYDQESSQLKYLATEKYQDWVKNIPPSPTPEDFYQWKTVPLDPQNPSSGTVSVLLTDGKGNAKYDQAGFKAAQKEYARQVDDAKDTVGMGAPQPLAPSTTALSDYKAAHDAFMGTASSQTPQQAQNQQGHQLVLSFGPQAKGRAPAAGTPAGTPNQSVYTTFSSDALETEIEHYEKNLPECAKGACSHDPAPPASP